MMGVPAVSGPGADGPRDTDPWAVRNWLHTGHTKLGWTGRLACCVSIEAPADAYSRSMGCTWTKSAKTDTSR